MRIAATLRLAPAQPEVLAFVGAGGKTSSMFQLGRELKNAILTTTTHLGNWQTSWADHHITINHLEDIILLKKNLPPGVVLVSGPETLDQRVTALDSASLEALYHLAKIHQLPLLIEADGARQRPLKAPAQHEPVIPAFTRTVIVTAGLSALGQPLCSKWIHRPENFTSLTKASPGQIITPDMLTRLLSHPHGGLKGIHQTARRICLLTQANTSEKQASAGWIAKQLCSKFDSILISTTEESAITACFEPTAGIILAAGEAKRYGQPKQLLDWNGKPFIYHIARTAIRAGLSPVVIVTGANAALVEAALADLEVNIVYCENWKMGQSASIRAAIEALGEQTGKHLSGKDIVYPGSAIFLLADQPFVSEHLLHALVETHTSSLSPIIAPFVDKRRGNPVLFDRSTFQPLMTLQGDTGGRALFSRYPVTHLSWLDASILQDVDTPYDYERIKHLAKELRNFSNKPGWP